MNASATAGAAPPAVSDPIAELIRYYNRVAEDPHREIAAFGFSPEKIHGCLVIDSDGSNPALEDIRERNDNGKPFHRELIVPNSGGRSGTSIQPNFLWDNTGYVLGIDAKGNPERCALMGSAFLALHRTVADELGDCQELDAVVKFLASWDPSQAPELSHWEDLIGQNVVFQIRGETKYVHQSDVLKDFWVKRQRAKMDSGKDVVLGTSLFDGQEKPLARLHPQVQGVTGANSTGAALVSFNKDAFTSFGKTQSFNSPLGVDEAFQYSTALQSLLSDSSRRFRVGDATVVFWTDSKSSKDVESAVQIFGDPAPPAKPSAEHSELVARLRGFIRDAAGGLITDNVDDPGAHFYLLGLSPSTSRLSIRFWVTGSVQELGQKLQTHLDDLAIDGLREDRIPTARSMLYQSVRDAKEISPRLAGETVRSILTGSPYPSELLNALVRRCRVNRNVSTMQAAILKACLNRRDRLTGCPPNISVSLRDDLPSVGYQLGRLLAVLDLSHLAATDGRMSQSTAASRMSMAATNPVLVFPELLRLNQHHRVQLPSDQTEAARRKTRTRRTFDALLGSVIRHVPEFPSSLTSDEQARFLVGFYQQTQFYFTPATKTVTSSTESEGSNDGNANRN